MTVRQINSNTQTSLFKYLSGEAVVETGLCLAEEGKRSTKIQFGFIIQDSILNSYQLPDIASNLPTAVINRMAGEV